MGRARDRQRLLNCCRGWLLLFATALGLVACAKGAGPEQIGRDTDTVSETHSVATTATETGSDTEDDETPPELPKLCRVSLGATTVSEPAGQASSTKGDGRWPNLALGDERGLVVYAYRDGAAPFDWDIRVADFDVAAHASSSSPDPLVASEPVAKGIASRQPAAVATTKGYLVIFDDARWDPTCTANNLLSCRTDLGALALDATGAPLSGAGPVRLTSGSGVSSWPGLASTDAGAFVGWVEAGQDGAAHAMVLSVDLDGNPGTARSLTPDADADGESRVQLAVLGDTMLVVYGLESPARVAAQRLTLGGELIGQTLILDEGGGARGPAVTPTQAGFLVVWRKQLKNDYEIMARSVSDAGELGQTQRLSFTTTDVGEPAVAWNTEQALVTWTSARPSGSEKCSVASCNAQIQAVLVSLEGSLTAAELTVSDDANDQTRPVVAWDGGGWTIAWEARRNLRQEVFYGRITCDP